ncbi:uncharacterized protein [Bemisia tabaci]|uniref:uncharacterized protein isoform X6 n=1 Tax=Bemisia tabaci TaxID=7038 RepID=UPI003B288508
MKNPIIVIIKLYHLSNYLVDGKRGFRQKFKPEDDVEPLCPLFPHEWPPEEIERRLKGDDIIPDVIPCSPKYVINRMTKFLGVIILILWFVNVGVLHSFITILWYLATQVTYIPGVTVYFGNKLEPEELKKEPVKCGWPVTPGHNYTLMLTGADDPSVANHMNREFLQWLVVDIPGSDVLKGTTIAKSSSLRFYRVRATESEAEVARTTNP